MQKFIHPDDKENAAYRRRKHKRERPPVSRKPVNLNAAKVEGHYVDDGMSCAQVAEVLNVSKATIWQILKIRGVKMRTNSQTKRGWSNPMAGLKGNRHPKYGRKKESFNSKKNVKRAIQEGLAWIDRLYQETKLHKIVGK